MRLLALLGLLAAGPALAQPAETVGQGSAALTASDRDHFWTAQRVIPMCWDVLQFPSQAARQAAQDFVRRTIKEGWLDLVDLDATWVDCPTSGSDRHVRVLLRSGDPSENGTTLRPGTLTLSTAQDRKRPPPDDPPGLLMGFPGTWNTSPATRARFQALILHEFGHVLGFGHEQDRPDGAGAACYNDSYPDIVRIGPADPLSIMGWSYCTTALGQLSLSDIHGVREVYGEKPIPDRIPAVAGIVATTILR